VDLSPEELFDVLHGQFENSAWNITVAENKIVQKLSDETDIVHVTSAPALGGMISSRDFVNTRTWRKKDGGYIIASNCAGKNLIKAEKGVTRGENGVTGFVILPHESSAFKCRFIWILNCDIKGYFPGSLIRKGSLSEQCCFVRNLRRHLNATIGSDNNAAAETAAQ
jgi:StAR-related lipid transfer protein 3